jgi:hypothetical protein
MRVNVGFAHRVSLSRQIRSFAVPELRGEVPLLATLLLALMGIYADAPDTALSSMLARYVGCAYVGCWVIYYISILYLSISICLYIHIYICVHIQYTQHAQFKVPLVQAVSVANLRHTGLGIWKGFAI